MPRTGLSPRRLKELTDRLVEDPRAIRRQIERGDGPETIDTWLDILNHARELELMAAPTLGEYIRATVAGSVAVASLGFTFAGPVGSVVAATALTVGAISGAITFYEAGRVIQKDSVTSDRLRAIARAQEILRESLD